MFTSPIGHDATIMPVEIFFIDTADAAFDGRSVGVPVHVDTNPTIGGVPTPARPIFTLGQAHMRITNPEEYHQARERVLSGSLENDAPRRKRT